MNIDVELPGEEPAQGPQLIDPTAPLPPRRLVRGADRLAALVGSRLLVGLSIRTPDGELVRREQFCGVVLEAADGVVIVEREGGALAIPADSAAFEPAPRGRYRLAGTGEIVEDPDYLSSWDLIAKG